MPGGTPGIHLDLPEQAACASGLVALHQAESEAESQAESLRSLAEIQALLTLLNFHLQSPELELLHPGIW